MIKRILLIGVALFSFCGQSGWAKSKDLILDPGHFFRVSSYINTLTITTTPPGRTYSNAGIKLLTSGYTVANLTPASNGFYLFSVSDTVPASLTLVGAPGSVAIRLCLNGVGSTSGCENSSVTTTRQKYAYVATGFNNSIYKCSANSDGTLTGCVITPSSGAPAWTPESTAFAIVSGVQYAYVASWPNGIVYQCNLNSSNGAFNTCTALTPTGSVYTLAAGITFATINGVQYGYVSDDDTKIFQCSLNSNGTFNICNPTPTSGTPAWTPASTTFATVNGTQYAYVASDNGNVYQCSLNTNGTFNLCSITPATGAPTWLPKSVTFATFSGSQYAYVSDDNGKVFQCSLKSDGTFNVCSITPASSAPLWNPRSIAFETFSGTSYAYVTDFGAGSPEPGNIFQCTLNASGQFVSCVDTPAFGVPSWGNLWWMAFN